MYWILYVLNIGATLNPSIRPSLYMIIESVHLLPEVKCQC